MSFLQTAFLAGLALVAVPLILHLFTRRRVQQVIFPALMLLADSKRRSMRILTLQQLLVLLCRMAAIGLLALAFTLPVLQGVRLSLPGTRTRVALHIILDNSASMGWGRGGVTLFDRAKSAAEKLLGGASYEDEITLELACGGPGATQSVNKLKQQVRAAEPGNCRAPLDLKINRAVHSLRRSPVPERRIVVLSDFQANGFRLKPPEHEKADARIIGLNFGAGTRRNNARVTAVELPMFPLVGEDVQVCFRVESDMQPESQIAVSLIVDGAKRGERTLILDAAARESGCFSVTTGEKGRHSGGVTISGDAMSGDNSRWFTFDVHEEIPVLLAAAPEAERSPANGAFYLARAIRTISSGQSGRPFKLDIASPASLDAKTVSEHRIVIVPDPGVLSKENILLLGEYLADGGGLFVTTSGGSPSDQLISKTFFGGSVSISPRASEKKPGKPGEAESFLTVGQVDIQHPIFRDLAGDVGAAVRETRFYNPAAVRALGPEIGAPLTLSDGGPAMVERRVGRGRVLLLASELAPGATNLALKPAFVPIVVRLCKYLGESASDERRDFTIGHDIRLSVEVPDGVTVLKAKNEETGATTELRRAEGGGDIFFAEEGRSLPCGVYDITDEKGAKIGLFTINSDTAESDLKSLSAAEWKLRYPGYDVVSVESGRFTNVEKLRELVFARRATALWFPFLLGAILFLLLEMIISNRK